MLQAGVREFADMPDMTPLVFLLDEAEAVIDAFGISGWLPSSKQLCVTWYASAATSA